MMPNWNSMTTVSLDLHAAPAKRDPIARASARHQARDGWSFASLLLLGFLGSTFATSAAADVIEQLSFTGTATCLPNFAFQECVGGRVGPLTGTYTLDVTTQQIMGAWSFTSPFESFSSTAPGATAAVYQGIVQNGVPYNVASFYEVTSTFNGGVTLGFTGANIQSELGAISTPTVITTNGYSGICLNVPGTAGCEPNVTITGATTLAAVPEPSSALLMSAGLLLGWLLRPSWRAARRS